MAEHLTTTAASDTQQDAWRVFAGDQRRRSIDVRDFVQQNYTPYTGNASLLAGPTERTLAFWGKLEAMFPVHFVPLTREQQLDVVNRTFHESM